jgi:hypothetical protein
VVSMALRSQNYNLQSADGITQTSDNYWSMGMGMEHRVNSAWSVLAMIEINQYPFLQYVVSSGSTRQELIAVALTQFTLLSQNHLWERGDWVLDSQLGLLLNPDKGKANFTAKRGYGYISEIGFTRGLKKNSNLHFGLWGRGMYQQVKNLDFSADSKRSTVGLSLLFGHAF